MRPRLLTACLLTLGVCVIPNVSIAQLTVYTWTGWGANAGFSNATNWAGNVAPPQSLTNTQLVFGNAGQTYVDYNNFSGNPKAYKLEISGNSQPYYFQGPEGTMHLGAGGIEYNPAQSVRSTIRDTILLHASQTWDIANGTLLIDGSITDYDWETTINGDFTITKTGAGNLYLNSDSGLDWSGGLTLSAGQVSVRANMDPDIENVYHPVAVDALGTGTLTFSGGTLMALPDVPSVNYETDEQALVIDNTIVSNGLISVKGNVDTVFSDSAANSVTLNANTTIQASGRPLYITMGVFESGTRKLTVDSAMPVVLEGTSGWTGGTEIINRGILIFAGEDNTPGLANSIKVSAEGYVGITNDQNVGGFQGELDKANTLGTVGFDSPIEGAAGTFPDAIDLTGFNATARLGSATQAILTGAITPQGAATDPYRFGGGGGFLQVGSALTGTRALVLDSPSSRPLTLYLTNGSTNYSGGTSVTHSGLIFGGAFSSIPGSAGSIMINQGGYVGFEWWGDQTIQQLVDNSLTKINPASVGAVGFDEYPWGTTIAANINLSGFSGALYLGTATHGGINDGFYDGMAFTGTITPAGGASSPFRFAGYKGGMLRVESNLAGTNGIHIGDPNSPATFGDAVLDEYSMVALTGNNSGLSGNITLYAGQLGVGVAPIIDGSISNSLGSGSLVVQGMSLPAEWNNANGVAPRPQLVTEYGDTIIPNNVTLNTNLSVGGYSNFELAGVISGPGGIYIEDDIGLTLSGNNTFGGGVYLYGDASLFLHHNNALGTGALRFGSTYGTEVYFHSSVTNPVIGGLASYQPDDYATIYAQAPSTVLTINQANNSWFAGELRSLGDDTMRVVKSGAGTLRLEDGGLYYHNGTIENSLPGTPEVSLQINQGAVVLSQDFYIEDSGPTIWVHGGTLVADNAGAIFSNQIYNPIVVDNGGKIAGNGHFATNLSIGTGATLSPGLDVAGGNPIGRLEIDHLNANAGGTLEWDIMKADTTANAWDQIFVSTPSTLDFTAINVNDPKSAATRFTLKVISRTLTGAQGLLADFNPGLNYSWLVFETDAINAFDPDKVIIDTSLFANSLDAGAGNGYFFLTQNGNDLMLNFSPVPEPSTYALMLAGLATAGLGYRRRKNRA